MKKSKLMPCGTASPLAALPCTRHTLTYSRQVHYGMRAAAEASDYLADPIDTYLAHARTLVFCARPTLWGFAVWGRPTKQDLDRLVILLARELAADVAP